MWSRQSLIFAVAIVCCSCSDNTPPSHANEYDLCTGSERDVFYAVRAVASEFGLVEDKRHTPKSEDVPLAIMFSSQRGKLVLSLFYFRGRLSYRFYEPHMDRDEDYSNLVAAINAIVEPLAKAKADGVPCSEIHGEDASQMIESPLAT